MVVTGKGVVAVFERTDDALEIEVALLTARIGAFEVAWNIPLGVVIGALPQSCFK